MHSKLPVLLSFLLLAVSPVLAATVPMFEPADCPFEVPEEAPGLKCGYVEVAENRDDPDGRTLRLAVAVLESFSENPKPDPLVFLSGGPGVASLQFIPLRLDSDFWNLYRQDRDLIFFDQRGTGYSEPAFCPELDVALTTTAYQGLTPVDQQRKELMAVAVCREQMLADGIDFAHYNSVTSARDLADLRIALGFDEWNLFGISYGTRLALVALREAPDGIRSVFVDSIYPPNADEAMTHTNFDRSLRLVFDRCAANAACEAEFPALEQDLYAMLQDLESRPIEIAMADSSRFPDGRIVVDGSLLAGGIYQGLYDGDFIEVLPLLVREVSARNVDVLQALADGLAPDPHNMRQGLYHAVQCFEGVGRAQPASVAADRAAYPELNMWFEGRDELVLCDSWHSERAGVEFAEPVVSDVPTLLIVGDYDPITPPDDARLAMQTLPNSTLVVVPGEGHGPTPKRECTKDLVLRFLDDPAKELDTSCTEDFPLPKFVTQVKATPGIARLMSQADGNGLPAPMLAAAVAVLVLGSALVAWPCAWAWRHLRGHAADHPVPARRARWLGGLVALLTLSFLGALASTVFKALSTNPYILVFGLPADKGWILAIPWIALLATLATAISAVFAWRSRWWSVAARVHYSLVALAGLGFIAWVGSLGLM